jgi:AraC-like DNA-binding protein
MRALRHSIPELIERVKDHLAHATGARVGIGELARRFGLSRSYLSQTFRAAERMSLYQYELEVRLRRAAALLPAADDLAALALELGFASHSHFSTALRRWAGCTPSAFRARARRPGLPCRLTGE